MRKFVETRLADLRGLLNSEATTVRSEVAKYVQKIIVTPTGRTYVASGSWNLLGTAAWCRGHGMHGIVLPQLELERAFFR